MLSPFQNGICLFKATASRIISEQVFLWLAMLMIAGATLYSDIVPRWNLNLYDIFARALYRQPSKDIVIIAIDDRSLDALGRWPWPRKTHAELIQRLTRAEVKSIGFSLIFSEPDLDNPQDDFLLSESILFSNRVILPVLHQRDLGGADAMTVKLPVPELTNAAAGLAHIDVELDMDGLARGLYLRAGLGYPTWSTLALAMLEVSGDGAPSELIGLRNRHLEHASPHAWVRDFHVLTPFSGPPGTFPVLHYVDVLRDDSLLGRLNGKHVLIGVTSAGLGGELPGPLSGSYRPMSSVEFHANVLDGLLQDMMIVPLPTLWSTLLSLVLIASAFPAFSIPKPQYALAVVVVLMITAVLLSLMFLTFFHLWYGPALPLLGLLFSFLLGSWYRLDSVRQQLFSSKERTEITVNSIADGVIATDSSGRVDYMNKAAESLTGYTLNEAQGQSIQNILQVKDKAGKPIEFDSLVDRTVRQRLARDDEHISLVNRSNHEYAIRINASPMRHRDGRARGMVVAFHDVSRTKQLLDRLAHQANYDGLTDLPNRTLLMDRLHHAIAHARRLKEQIAVLFIDLDNFKKINDGLGHSSGDLLLMAVADQLRGLVRETDSVARLGGDEFVIIFENLNQPGGAGMLARKLLEILAKPFVINDHKIYLSCSIGISIFPKDGKDVETLLKNADTAMYRAKELGRNNFQFFSHTMNERILEQLSLEKALRQALEKETLELYYQPQVHLVSGRIVGVEALLRWEHPELGFISPAKFIPLAEETGLINPLGAWVFRKACEQMKVWHAELNYPLAMAINLSPRQFINGNLLELIRLINENRIDPKFIKLEITEGVLLHDFEHATQVLKKFRDLGCSVSIDDFGTGYSSLSYLRRIPADQIKIDRSFVANIDENPRAAAITLAIISMAHGIGLQVIAEGVETKPQLGILKMQRCDEVQGYLFSRPQPAARISKLLTVIFDTRISTQRH